MKPAVRLICGIDAHVCAETRSDTHTGSKAHRLPPGWPYCSHTVCEEKQTQMMGHETTKHQKTPLRKIQIAPSCRETNL